MPLALSGRPDEAQAIRVDPRRARRRRQPDRHRRRVRAGEDEVGHNERLIAKALQGPPRRVSSRPRPVISGPAARGDRSAGPSTFGRPARRRRRRSAPTASTSTSSTVPIENVPYAESVGAFKELQDEGGRRVGLSNCTVDQLEEALGVSGIVSVQNQLSLGFTRTAHQGRGRRVHASAGSRSCPWSPLGGIGNAAGAADVDPVKAAAEQRLLDRDRPAARPAAAT